MIQSLQSVLTKTLLTIGLVGCLALGMSQPAGASGKNEMTLSPARADIDLKAGQPFTDSFRLYNTGETDFKIKFYTEAFQATNDGYTTQTDNHHSQLNKWIKLSISETTINAKESVEVKYTINAPKDLPDGGQYAVIFAEIINEAKADQTGVGTTSRLGMPIYATTNGQNRYDGKFHEIKTPGLVFGSSIKPSFNAKNTGNTHYFVDRSIEIKNMFGNVKLTDTRTGDVVAPEVDRTLFFEWNNPALFDIATITVKASAFDSEHKPIFDTIEHTKKVVFISPILLIGIIIIILIIGATYVANKKVSYRFKK